MRRLRVLLALLLAFAMIAAACGGSDDTGDAETSGEAETETEAVLDEVPEDLNATAEEEAEEAEEEPAEEEPAEEASNEPQQGGTLVVATQTFTPALNGNIASGTGPNTPGTQLFASPLRFDENWVPQPYLADSWAFSDDGLSLTLNLNPNATFHDGEPVESHDVAFSIDMNKNNHPFSTMFGAVTDVDTSDPNVAVINLANPHPAILIAMSPALLPVFPEHIYGEVENIRDCTCNNTPGELIGSGPFVLTEFDSTNQIIRVEAFEDFFLGRPYVDEIAYVNRPAANELLTEMQNGEIHIGNVQGVADLERANSIDTLTVTPQGLEGIGAVVSMQFNLEDEVLSNKEVRQAIAYSIDKDFIINELHGGLPFRAKSPIHPGSPYYDDTIEGYDYDPAKAGELLDAAGFPADGDGNRGITLTMDWIPTADDYQSVIAEYSKAALADVGIDLELRASPDFPTWGGYIAPRDYDLTMQILFMWADPIIGVHRSFLEANIVPTSPFANTAAYINPEVEAMLAAAGTELDIDARIAAYAEIQAILADDVPFHWIETLPTNSVYNTAAVQNPPLTIWGIMSPLHEVWLAQ